MSLRARLVLVTAAAVAASVALASVIVFFLVRNELRGQVDRNLTAQAQQVATLPPLTSPLGPKRYALHVRAAPFGNPFQLVDADGNVLLPQVGFEAVQAALPGISRARAVAAGTRKDFYFQSPVFGVDARVYVSRIGPHLAVEVAAPLASVNNELGKIKLWLLLVGFGGIGIASIAGFLVARAALAPVRELSDTAERVRETRDLTQRIKVEGSDELSRLASTTSSSVAFGWARSLNSASSPSPATSTSYPCNASARRNESRTAWSSSTTRIPISLMVVIPGAGGKSRLRSALGPPGGGSRDRRPRGTVRSGRPRQPPWANRGA